MFGSFRDKAHVLAMRVYFADTDAAGIIYHGRYVEFAERGRSELLSAIGFGVGTMRARFGAVWVIRDLHIQYRAPGFVDDLLEVVTSIESLGGASVTMRQEICRVGGGNAGQAPFDVTLASARVCAALLDQSTNRPKRFDPQIKAALGDLL